MASELVQTVKRQLLGKAYLGPLERALAGTGIAPEKVGQALMQAFLSNPKLQECDPATIYGSGMTCAQLGLIPDGVSNMVYLIPYKNGRKSREQGRTVYDCTVVLGYKGLETLAYSSGMVSHIERDIIYPGEEWTHRKGSDPYWHHVPDFDLREHATLDKAIGAYAVAHLPHCRFLAYFAPRSLCLRLKQKALQKDSRSPWGTPEGEPAMWMKTAVRRVCNQAPTAAGNMLQAARLQLAVALDERAALGVEQKLERFNPFRADGGESPLGEPYAAPEVEEPPEGDEDVEEALRKAHAESEAEALKAAESDLDDDFMAPPSQKK